MGPFRSICAAGFVLSAAPAFAQDPGLEYGEEALPPIANTYESGCARADRFVGVELHSSRTLVAKFSSRIDQVRQQLESNMRGYDAILAEHPKEGPYENFNRGLISCERDQAALALDALAEEQKRVDALPPPPAPEVKKYKKNKKKAKRSRKRAELSGFEFSLV